MPMTVRMVKVLALNGMVTQSAIQLGAGLTCVDTLNSKYNEKYAKSYNKVKELKGYGNTKIILHKELQLMAYRSSLNKNYYNSEDSTAVDFDDEYLLKNTRG